MKTEDTTGDETTVATEGNDTIEGGAGNDTILGGEGNDDLEHPLEGLGDEAAVIEESAAEAPRVPADVKAALEAEYPVLTGGHGTHDAAMAGRQTDASGSYTAPDRTL